MASPVFTDLSEVESSVAYLITPERDAVLVNLLNLTIDSTERNYIWNIRMNNTLYSETQRTELNRIREKYKNELQKYYE